MPFGRIPVEAPLNVEFVNRGLVGFVYGLPVPLGAVPFGKSPLGMIPVGKTPLASPGADALEEFMDIAPVDLEYSGWPSAAEKALLERTWPLDVALILPDIVNCG